VTPAGEQESAQGHAAPPADDTRTIRLPRRRKPDPLMPDLEVREVHKGSRPGTKFVRIVRAEHPLRRTGETTLQATREAERPRTIAGRLARLARRVFIGAPLTTQQVIHERLTKVKGLAIFASDNLSSSAYATEEILLVLILAGTGALTWSIPISLAIATLVLIVVVSYRQTIKAYPHGGGAYIVSKDNLGDVPGTTAAASLLVDYVLTVAVSIAAGVAAITSAFPDLDNLGVIMSVSFVGIMTLGNLRGIRESGNIFSAPAYFFLLAFAALLIVGFVRVILGLGPVERVEVEPDPVTHSLTLFLILRAFSSGSAALTGIEAISNGVPAFKAPEARNAATTLTVMGAILATIFVGLTILAHEFDIVPSEDKTVVSQVAHAVFGSSILFYAVQAATALILILAANTAFSDFPRLSSILARDGFMPRQFSFRGDRLAFTNGILALGALASALLILFGASTHSLIPLYAVGVFISFTLSQAGMVVHWLRLKEDNWRLSVALNATGAVATGVVAVVIASTKFADGAWITLIAIAGIVVGLHLIRRHYRDFEKELASPAGYVSPGVKLLSSQRVIVPVNRINRAVLWTLEYAMSISDNVTAVHIEHEDEETGDRLQEAWQREIGPDIPLVVIESPYRSFVAPFLAYLDALGTDRPVTVTIPQFVTKHWWDNLLHNGTVNRLHNALKRRKYTVVVDVPWLLKSRTAAKPEPEPT
jgi:amino acid transporter